jgi:hypothetical protein
VSTPGIIAAVTEALRRRLAAALAAAITDTSDGVPLVTVLPLDRAISDNPNGLNVFLYQILPDEVRRSTPALGAPAEPPALGLRLRFLVSALGPHDDGTHADDHRLLALALRELHERPILDDAELGADAARVAPLPLDAAELAALWASARASRRVSVAYEVSDVRIDARADVAASATIGGLAASFVERVTPTAHWTDLVLPPSELDVLRTIADQIVQARRVHEEWGFARRPGARPGVTALFLGEAGTGRRLAAEILAMHLGAPLHVVDLAAVASKYVGETEKNLGRVFDAAERAGAVLFFDDADTLFGRRDAGDGRALVRRMESYRGLAILAATRSRLDRVALERLRFVVDFPRPEPEARRAIWAAVFPPGTPLEPSLDLDRLAALSLDGGSIRNVALTAACMAAAAQQPVGMAQILAAVELERRKLDRRSSAEGE